MWLQSIVQPQLPCAFACTDTRKIEDSSILKFTSFRMLFEAQKCGVAGPEIVARGFPFVGELSPAIDRL
jgi:hypothetical protein